MDMQENINTTALASSNTRIISEEELTIVWAVIYKALEPVLAVFGTVSNILNMIIFWKLGLSQSVNLSFWSMSLSDFLYSLMSVVANITHNLGTSVLSTQLSVNMMALNGIINWYRRIFLDISSCITTYLAIARCCCVTMPLRFNNVFRLDRTIVILVCILIVNVGFTLPLVTSIELTWKKDAVTNTSQIDSSFFPQFLTVKEINNMMNRTIIPLILLLISIVCSVILTHSLAKASKRRQEMTRPKSITTQISRDQVKDKKPEKGKNSSHVEKDSNNYNFSNKELQVVKAVTLVTLVLGITLLVYSINALAEICVPELMARRKYKNTYYTINAVSRTMSQINACVNIFIYYKFNSRFRILFQRLRRIG